MMICPAVFCVTSPPPFYLVRSLTHQTLSWTSCLRASEPLLWRAKITKLNIFWRSMLRPRRVIKFIRIKILIKWINQYWQQAKEVMVCLSVSKSLIGPPWKVDLGLMLHKTTYKVTSIEDGFNDSRHKRCTIQTSCRRQCDTTSNVKSRW